MMYGWFNGYGWIGMVVNMVITLGIIIGLVFLVVWIIRRTNSNPSQSNPQVETGKSAKDFAEARYAKGEITREEYQQIISDLTH